MACCAPTNAPGPGAATTDSCKRVNYTLGMLMGVDDFVQEQVYNGSRRRELAREVLGYGTVHGLDVIVEADGDKGPRLRVTPGMAWLPSGTPVCVDSDQCANLNDWLAANATAVQGAISGSPAAISLYVVLSYVHCLVDNVPIPGEPCRSDDELMQPSRIADSFRLELRLAPPDQREEDALRDFVQWLVSLPLISTSPPLDEAGFIEQLRVAAHDWLDPSSPPLSPPGTPADYMTGVAPAGTSEALLRTALRLWTTELRPLWMARADCSCNAPPIPALDDAVLLAQLDIGLVATLSGGGWQVSDEGAEPVVIGESHRPILLSLRMVQELILRQRDAEPGDAVMPETAFGQMPDPGAALSYARSDHTHGSPDLPPLGGDLSGTLQDARIESLQGIPLATSSPIVEGQVLTFESGRWVPGDLPPAPAPAPAPAIPPLVGDVVGPIGANELGSLQGHPLNAPNPQADQVLRFVNGAWTATDLPAPPPPPEPAPAPAPAPAGQFVERGTPAPYQIVAAGEVHVVVAGGQASTTMRPAPGYGDLDAKTTAVGTSAKNELMLAFTAKVSGAKKLPNYIVKLTPVWVEGMTISFRLYLEEAVNVTGTNAITFRVRVLGDSQFVDGTFPVTFQVEVSRF